MVQGWEHRWEVPGMAYPGVCSPEPDGCSAYGIRTFLKGSAGSQELSSGIIKGAYCASLLEIKWLRHPVGKGSFSYLDYWYPTEASLSGQEGKIHL